MLPLDPRIMPLGGLNLIEASAGTGKTYTIASLYLRLVLELGLEVDRILVVTYTKAATEELRDRIRARVAQALTWLRVGDWSARRQEDALLADLLDRLPDQEAAQTLLTDALSRMDEAAIYTIHGFCQRTLQEHAFESGSPFEAEFITDEEALRQTAIRDFWRWRVSAADKEEAGWIRQRWRNPDALLQQLAPTLASDDLHLIPNADVAALDGARDAVWDCFERIKGHWAEKEDEIADLLGTSPALKRQSYNKNIVASALAAAAELARAESPPLDLPPHFERLTNDVLADKTKDGASPPQHLFFDLCSQYSALLPAQESLRVANFLIAAREHCRAHLDRRKDDEGLLYFDDLLRRLDRALQGEGAEALAEVMRKRHPVALIDEFQDTDPQQYRIFQRVYHGQPQCGLFLIGDPKQAIYAFRGADIFTYMQARADSGQAGNQFTLDTNWRSSSRLIAGLNALFGGVAKPFIYQEHIQYLAVKASEQADAKPLLIDGAEPTPLQLWFISVNAENETKRPPGFIRKEAAQSAAAVACAERIAELLNGADAGRVTIGDRPVLPKDIAILVRTHREGDAVQEALRACGVRSVSLSQASVFLSEDAGELATLLGAFVERHDEGLVRAALATSLLGRCAAELDQLFADELAWEQVLARFQGYRDRWQAYGFMAAFQSLLAEEGIAPRLLRRPDGERRLTNLLQLAELLQVASREHPGIDGLLRWFADQRAEDSKDEERQLRLESDEGLVKVVTMHKSKGLEYPLVFIPFPWSLFPLSNKRTIARFHLADRSPCLDLGSTGLAANMESERVEVLAERLRLFYVAVTRAAKLCVLCWGRINGVEDSAMGYLLHPDMASDRPRSRFPAIDQTAIRADLEALAQRAPQSIRVTDLPEPSGARWGGAAAAVEGLAAAVFGGRIDASWRVTSYSALIQNDDSERPDYDGFAGPAGFVLEDEPPGLLPGELVGEASGEAPVDPIFELPTGTRTGRLVHELFEHLDFPLATPEVIQEQAAALLGRYDNLRGTGAPAGGAEPDWAPVLAQIATNVLDTKLDTASGLRLRNIALADRLTELEFHFPLGRLSPQRLHAVLSQFEGYRQTAANLEFQPLRGLMRGFVDLIFRHQGRYYIVDYKSNRLGRRLTDYAPAKLRAAVHEHRYDLQYLIYTLALHRFLGRRLKGYDFERHFGGIHYLFLRGMRPAHGPALGVWSARPSLDLIQALDALIGNQQEAA